MLAALLMVSTAAYTVSPGDTLSEIAERQGISTAELVASNDLASPDLIRVGQVLTIPGGAPDPAPAAVRGGTHVVQAGESLSAIAARYGLSLDALAAANGLVDPNAVKAGFLLRLDDTPPPTPGTRSSESSKNYTVVAGDTLSVIAVTFGTTTIELAATNGISNAGRIFVGQKLAVPGLGGPGTSWSCPVPGASYVNDFGFVKPDGRSHEGIDMFAWQDAPISAPVGGVLRQVEGARAGRQFTLEGDDGITYIGAHMSDWGASGRVEQGDTIGYVGTSGNARGTTPHTHFEMHARGVMSPYPTLLQYCR